jgi:hypothetical protein
MFPHIIEDAREFSFIFRHGPFLLCCVYIYTFYFTFLFLLHFLCLLSLPSGREYEAIWHYMEGRPGSTDELYTV